MFISVIFQDSRLFLLKICKFFLEILLNFVFFGKIKEKWDLNIHLGTSLRLVFLFDKIKMDQGHELILRNRGVLDHVVFGLFNCKFIGVEFARGLRLLLIVNLSIKFLFQFGFKGDLNTSLSPGFHIDMIMP